MKPPIFIFSSGRSGSTLLQRILNTYDDIMIWGEHGGFLKDTAASFFKVLEDPGNRKYLFPVTGAGHLATKEQLFDKKDPNAWQAWINWFTYEDVYTLYRRHVQSFFLHAAMGKDCSWGFKEVRYGANDRVIEFLKELYPEAVFVFISRNGFNTLASQLRAFAGIARPRYHLALRKVYRTCKAWSEQNRSLLDWHSSGKIRSVWIRFEDLARSLNAVQPLVEMLGKKVSADQKAVLEMENGRGGAFDDSAVADRWKAMNWLQLLVAETGLGRMNRKLGYESPWRVRWLGEVSNSLWPRWGRVTPKLTPLCNGRESSLQI